MRPEGESSGNAERLVPWSVALDDTVAGLHDPERVRVWLLEEGSITARLRQHWPKVQVDVKVQGVFAPEPAEMVQCGLQADTACWIRVVQLHAAGVPLVSAQTVVPGWASAHPWHAVATLGTRPLADLLFGEQGIERSAREFALYLRKGRVLPARRCVYTRNGAPLWLTEVFDLLAQPS